MSKINLPKFTFEDPTGLEEELEIKMNGKTIASLNHDYHGWTGMSAVRDAVLAIENQLKTEAKKSGK